MPLFRRETRSQLKTLVDDTIMSFQDKALTKAAAVTAALPKARKICENEYDAVVCRALEPLFNRALSRSASVYDRLPSLIDNLPLPYRIAVPPAEMAIDPDTVEDEEDAGIVWIVLHKATIAEARRNVAMRDAHIAGALTERDKVAAVVDMAAALTADEDAVLGDVLGRKAA